MFSKSGYAGVGFFTWLRGQRQYGQDPPARFARRIFLGSRCRNGLLDRSKEQLTVVFMAQVIGSEARLTLRRDLCTLVYSAMTESLA
jgi:hypothetical protein